MISYTKTKNNPNTPVCHLDSITYYLDDSTPVIAIRGWVLHEKGFEIRFINSDGVEVHAEMESSLRREVLSTVPGARLKYPANNSFGFLCSLRNVTDKRITMQLVADGEKVEENLNIPLIKKYDSTNRVHRALQFYYRNGFVEFCRRIKTKITEKFLVKKANQTNYLTWIRENEPSEKELNKQREMRFKKAPFFSIVVPLYNTPINFLESMIESVISQTYDNWELCMADGSSDEILSSYFSTHYNDNPKIKYQKLEKNLGISENTNAAIAMASGGYIVLGDHDDLFAENALFELARIIENNSDADVIYSDEDKINYAGNKRFEPYFKSDFNIDLLCSNNYICHLFCVKRELLDQVGGLCSAYDGAQDHDFILRCVEKADGIYHIPRILYHWRCHENSTAMIPESKMYAFENGKKAIKSHFDRIGVEVEIEDGKSLGQYHAKHKVQGSPLVSILIPNKDHIDDLDKCLTSVDKNSYQNYEVIIIENNSVEEETFTYYQNIDNHHKNCKVVYWEHEFNYSKINNYGAEYARGQYLLFLNNDVEAINEDWLERMLGYCQREDVGIVGAKLLYPDDVIQHAGVILGFGGIAGHAFIGLTEEQTHAFSRAVLTQDYTAVTAACMMTKREIFDAVEGFDEKLQVAFNDIDYCMKVRRQGKLVVYNSMAELYHYESKSRGLEDTPEKLQRFEREITFFQDKWGKELAEGDPYYNVNLTLDRSDFSIR